MDLSQIKLELSQVEQAIQRAAQVVQSDRAAQAELRNCVRELDEKSKQARQVQDATRLAQFIDAMEATGERAKSACERNSRLNASVKTAVQHAYQRLSSLKQHVH